MNFRIPVPREHGAWGLLLQPFVVGAALARRADPLLLAVLAAVLLVFLMREPLLILARQRWVWRVARPESGDARKALALELAMLAVPAAWLARELPFAPLAVLGTVAAAMTAVAVWAALRNRQRSIALQAASAIGLSSTVLLAALASTRTLPAWSWQAWALLSAHAIGSIFVVHARLARGLRSGPAWAAQAGHLAMSLALPAWPVWFSVAVNAIELTRAGKSEPLRRVGWRTLGVAVVHAGLVVWVLWSSGTLSG